MRVRRDATEIPEQHALTSEVALIKLLKERPNREVTQCTLFRRIPDLDVKLTIARRCVSFLPRVICNGIVECSYIVRAGGRWQREDGQCAAQERRRADQQNQRNGAERAPNYFRLGALQRRDHE